MAEHNYKFNITMTCGGCSGAVERVLKKLEGKSLPVCTARHAERPVSPLLTNPLPDRCQRIRRLPRLPDRYHQDRREPRLHHRAREDQEDRQGRQLWRGRWCFPGCVNRWARARERRRNKGCLPPQERPHGRIGPEQELQGAVLGIPGIYLRELRPQGLTAKRNTKLFVFSSVHARS